MKKFKVSVVRVAYAVREIEVDALDEKDAQDVALETAGNYEFSEHSSTYEVEGVYPTEKQ